jgi:hypothetical protein
VLGDSISLDVYESITPFIIGSDLAQPFTATAMHQRNFRISQCDTDATYRPNSA